MHVRYFGQSCFLVEFGDKRLMFDPFISSNPKAVDIDLTSIHCDYILLSHGHQDHVADAETLAKQCDAKIISNYEIVSWYGAKGIEGHPLNHGGKWTFDFGTVKYVNAVHSSLLPDGSNGGNPGGFVIWNETHSVYFAGDTGLTMDMKLIPLTCPKLDLAILPIGDNFTMGVDDAVHASDFVECDKVLGCHYDTFGYIEIDKIEAVDKFRAKGKELILMNIGDTKEFK